MGFGVGGVIVCCMLLVRFQMLSGTLVDELAASRAGGHRLECVVVCGRTSKLPENLRLATAGMSVAWRNPDAECDATCPPEWFSRNRRIDVVLVETSSVTPAQRIWLERMDSLGCIGRIVELEFPSTRGQPLCPRRSEQLFQIIEREFPGAGERVRARLINPSAFENNHSDP